MNLPSPDHPVWKILQGIISLTGMIIFLIHTDWHGDIAGAAGIAGAGNLFYRFWKA